MGRHANSSTEGEVPHLDRTGLLSGQADASADKPWQVLERTRRSEDWNAFLFSAGAVVAMLIFGVVMANIKQLRDANQEKEIGVAWSIVTAFCGWFAFIAWSVSFYPQTVQNFVRKSVVGMNLDYQLYNLFGFAAYSFYNCAYFFNS